MIGADPEKGFLAYTILRNNYRRCNDLGGAPGVPEGPPCLLFSAQSESNTAVEFGKWPCGTGVWNQVYDLGTDNWFFLEKLQMRVPRERSRR